MRRNRAQVVLIVAVLFLVVLLFLALVVDVARVVWDRQSLRRAADAAGKAAMVVVGDHMLTQVVGVQTAAATYPCSSTPGTGTAVPAPAGTPTPGGLFSWLDDDHRATLIASPMRTRVATNAAGYAELNGYGPSHPRVTDFDVIYPYAYHPGDQDIKILISIQRELSVLFGSLLGIDDGVIFGEAQQSIPQR